MIRFLASLVLGASAVLYAAPDTTPFPSPPDKKGIQVQMVDDAITLGIHHATLNVSLGAMFFMQERPEAIKFTHEGRDYFINGNYARSLDKQSKPLSSGTVMWITRRRAACASACGRTNPALFASHSASVSFMISSKKREHLIGMKQQSLRCLSSV